MSDLLSIHDNPVLIALLQFELPIPDSFLLMAFAVFLLVVSRSRAVETEEEIEIEDIDAVRKAYARLNRNDTRPAISLRAARADIERARRRARGLT